MDNTNKLLSALSYFSVIFLQGLFPLIVFFASEDEDVKRHAKRAFISHIVPLVTAPFIIWAVILAVTGHDSTVPFVIIPSFIVCFILGLIVIIWNIIQGIKVLR